MDVPVDEYLARAPGLAGLVDASPRGGWAATAWTGDDVRLDAARLAGLVRRRDNRRADVRLLVEDGQQIATEAAELAANLFCDVYPTPPVAGLRFIRETSSIAGESWDAIAVDLATGEAVDWTVVRPDDTPQDLPTWFVSVRGRLRQRSGLVSLPLPGGVAFTTRGSFRDTARMATSLRAGTAQLTVVAVDASRGRFEISEFDGTESPLGGAAFATLILASRDVVHPDVQLAVTWPTDADVCEKLDRELTLLAQALDRTVWVPRPAGSAVVVSGCAELAAVDEVGSPSSWQGYPSGPREDWRPAFGTDADGRLMPVGAVEVTAFAGVPFVSVPVSQLERLRPWYESVPPRDELFSFDLALLEDGRLGVCREDGLPISIGPQHLRELLTDAGWSGQDLLLLTQPPQPYWEVAVDHAGHLADGLKVDLWMPAAGAQVSVEPDGSIAALAPDGAGRAWLGIQYATPDVIVASTCDPALLPAALAGHPPATPSTSEHRPAPPSVVPGPESTGDPVTPSSSQSPDPLPQSPGEPAAVSERAADVAGSDQPAEVTASDQPAEVTASDQPADVAGTDADSADVAGSDVAGSDVPGSDVPGSDVDGSDIAVPARGSPAPGQSLLGQPLPGQPLPGQPLPASAIEPVGVLPRATKSGRPHRVPWLPPTPVVNARPVDLYVWTPLASEEIDGWGLPSADLFLMAGQDPLGMAERRSSGCLLRVRAAAHGVVDLQEHSQHMPGRIRQVLADTGCTHLLPVAWLPGVTVTARYDLDGAGGIAPRTAVARTALAIRFEGAEHGVPGLPNEVVHWPERRIRAEALAYLMLPDYAGDAAPGQPHPAGSVPLSRRRPKATNGHRLFEIRIHRRSAIDVPATLTRLAGLPVIGRLHDFYGLDLLLSQREFSGAVVVKVWRGGDRWRPVSGMPAGQTLAATLAGDLA